jgi:GntR family transcriptional repressor for pyruvate dehydrogenase complex
VTEGGPIVEEILDARKMLECHNVEMAAKKIDTAGLDQLRELVNDMDRALSDGDLRLFSEMDHGFHVAIAKVAGNRFLFKVFENTKSLLFYQQLQVNRYPGNPQVAIKQHKKILEAFAKRDAANARKAMAEHLNEALRVWKKAIETQTEEMADSAESRTSATSMNSARR